MADEQPDRRVVQCNLAHPVNAAPAGARAYVSNRNPGWGGERIEVLMRSRSGRWVRKWQSIKALHNFRVKNMPPEHPLYGDTRVNDWGDGSDGVAEELNQAHERETGRSRA